jgi:succinate-acetate transporter protein
MDHDYLGCHRRTVRPERPSAPVAPAKMADPAAWAVTAFATTSFMLGMYQTGLLNAAGTPCSRSRRSTWRSPRCVPTWVVLVFAVLAWYHAAGDVIAATFGRKILPFGPPPVK